MNSLMAEHGKSQDDPEIYEISEVFILEVVLLFSAHDQKQKVIFLLTLKREFSNSATNPESLVSTPASPVGRAAEEDPAEAPTRALSPCSPNVPC